MLSLDAWLQKLETLPRFNIKPAPDRIKILLARLNLQPSFFIVTLAGTNGKGTSAHFLAHYFYRLGYKVGLFTSPHLEHFRERIAVDGAYPSDEKILSALKLIESAAGDLFLSYFDYSFLAALLIFSEQGVNFACLEVGMGGRLDAVNALTPHFTIITSIGLDHTEVLGASREEIGFAKAGIMRPQVMCVCGDPKTPVSIQAEARELQAALYQRTEDFDIDAAPRSWSLKIGVETLGPFCYPEYLPLANMATVIMSIHLLHQHPRLTKAISPCIDFELINQLLATLQVPGRMQRFYDVCEIIVDVAHNPDSVAYLAQQLQNKPIQGKTYVLCAACADKDLVKMFALLVKQVDSWHFLDLHLARSASTDLLGQAVQQAGKQAGAKQFEIATYQDGDLGQVYAHLRAKFTASDQLVVFGSFSVAGAFLTFLRQEIL